MKAFPRDIEVRSMKERHIGVENELYVTTSEYQEVTDEVQEALSKRGILQSIGHDGGGREFRTVPIRVKSLKQVKGERYLREYYEFLKPNTEVVDSGGTHIHISILNTDHENMESNATALGVAFFDQFQKIAGRQTFWARAFDERMSIRQPSVPRIKQVLDARKEHGRSYYCKGAILSPTMHQTLEFRGPKGSNDSDEILAWVEFLDNVVKTANRKSIDGVKFRDLLKGERISKYLEKLDGWRALSESELNKTVNVMALA